MTHAQTVKFLNAQIKAHGLYVVANKIGITHSTLTRYCFGQRTYGPVGEKVDAFVARGGKAGKSTAVKAAPKKAPKKKAKAKKTAKPKKASKPIKKAASKAKAAPKKASKPKTKKVSKSKAAKANGVAKPVSAAAATPAPAPAEAPAVQ